MDKIKYIKQRIYEIIKSKTSDFIIYDNKYEKILEYENAKSFFLKKEKILISITETKKILYIKIYFIKNIPQNNFVLDLIKIFRREFKSLKTFIILKKISKIEIKK